MLICRNCGTENKPDPGGPVERLRCGNCHQPTLYRKDEKKENAQSTGGAVLGAAIAGLIFVNPVAAIIGAVIGAIAGSEIAKKEQKGP